MKIDKSIKGKRLSLRTLTDKEAHGQYKNWVQDKCVNQYLELRHTIPKRGELKKFIARMNESSDNLLLGMFIAGNKHIGNIKLGPIDWRNKRGVLGLMIGDRACWGKGYATEAIITLTDYAFTVLNLNKVYAGCYAENIASYKAFMKSGYKEEGRQREYWKVRNGFMDNILLGRNQSSE